MCECVCVCLRVLKGSQHYGWLHLGGLLREHVPRLWNFHMCPPPPLERSKENRAGGIWGHRRQDVTEMCDASLYTIWKSDSIAVPWIISSAFQLTEKRCCKGLQRFCRIDNQIISFRATAECFSSSQKWSQNISVTLVFCYLTDYKHLLLNEIKKDMDQNRHSLKYSLRNVCFCCLRQLFHACKHLSVNYSDRLA